VRKSSKFSSSALPALIQQAQRDRLHTLSHPHNVELTPSHFSFSFSFPFFSFSFWSLFLFSFRLIFDFLQMSHQSLLESNLLRGTPSQVRQRDESVCV
jgi:hypothetical protein